MVTIKKQKKNNKEKKHKTFKTILLVLLIALFFVFIWLLRNWIVYQNNQFYGVAIETDRNRYQEDESLRLKIENDSEDSLCFSSIFPYFLERKENDKWTLYKYQPLIKKDLIVKCMLAGEVKAFETVLFGTKGIHRIAIPFCANCQIGEEFKANKIYHSNEFIIR